MDNEHVFKEVSFSLRAFQLQHHDPKKSPYPLRNNTIDKEIFKENDERSIDNEWCEETVSNDNLNKQKLGSKNIGNNDTQLHVRQLTNVNLLASSNEALL